MGRIVTGDNPHYQELRLAYADPPYFGSCQRYGHHHPDGRCWNDLDTHAALIERLAEYDGWALSLTTNSLRIMLPLCPDDVRVMAWIKKATIWKKYVNPCYAWEPVIVRRARKLDGPEAGAVKMWNDWLLTPRLQAPDGFTGAKPLAFCRWLFAVMGAEAGDTLDDLFPGTGGVGRAWTEYSSQGVLAL